jgi:methenyltetrahydrofolate cyclohydrolase
MAAALVAMAARLAREWPQASEVVERAEALRSRVEPLAMADADAYAKVLEALRLPRGVAAREAEVAAAISGAADVPLAVAEAASEVATLAALVAQAGSAPVRGDAVVAAEIAEAAARGAAELVAINLGDRNDARVRHAKELAATTREAARRAAGAP